ncbi:TRAP transporter large permease [Halomonas sp. 25-S5]|uniref:TRAP transporter large permease n=1 Tax=Halomonas sp. 25-S5 TaxID=2994065 RepID=UPI0024685F8A|nr:TRAP transporter large permease [Halomonas sp. 25-S5]
MLIALSFLGLMLLGVPVGFVLLGAALVFVLQTGNYALIGALPQQMFSSLEIFDLLAIPLFILLGEIMSESGMTRRLFAAAQALLAWVPRSLAYVNLVANLFLAAILGSANAQVAVMSRVCVPEMMASGYTKKFATALTIAASLLGPIIPPSMIFIIYGVVARVPIDAMFIGGILPGLLLFLTFSLLIAFLPSGRPDAVSTGDDAGMSTEIQVSRLRRVLAALPALAVPALIVGGILSGAFTPTESAAVAVAAALLVGAVGYRELSLKRLPELMFRSAVNSAVVMFLIAAARIFGFVLTFYRVPQKATELMVAFTSDPTLFLLLLVGLLLLIGAVMDGMAALIILVPILLPIAQSAYFLDPVHFGIIVCLTLVLGLVTPPVGTALYIAASINQISIGALSRALIPFILAALLVVLAIVLAPILVTALA